MGATAAAAAGGRTAREEWREGWPVVLAGAVGIGAVVIHTYALGTFIVPLSQAYGWSRAEISLGPAILSVMAFLIAPHTGRLADRFGSRRIAIPGFCAFCCALAALGLAGPSIWTWWAHWLLLSLCTPFASVAIYALAVASRFDRSRGLALATALSGPGLIATFVPLVAVTCTQRFGWQWTFPILAAGAFTIGLPILLAFLYGARDLARRRPAAAAEVTAGIESPAVPPVAAAAPLVLPGVTLGQALRLRAFWLLTAAGGLIGTGVTALMVHFVPMTIARGIDASTGATVAGLIGISAIVGRLMTGTLMDHLPGRVVGACVFLMPVGACVLLMLPGGVPLMIVAAIAIGLAVGAEFDVLAVLVSRYLGMRAYAAIYGQIAAVFGLGVGFGPAIGGALFDMFGSYRPMLALLGGLFLVPPLLTILLGRQPHWSRAGDVA